MATTLRESEISMEEGIKASRHSDPIASSSPAIVVIIQKIIAEIVGTYFLMVIGFGAIVVNKIYGDVTFPGICITWGLVVMTLIYSLSHVSGAHFNPAVTIAFAVFGRFPWKEVPLYIGCQLLGSLLASWTMVRMFDVTPHSFFGTTPKGSTTQSFALEIIISSFLMFVISGVNTDDRANGDFGGFAVGMTITLNSLMAGPVSGASMNPARSIGPAVVKHVYKGLWAYIIGPVIGTVLGAFVYNWLRVTDKSLRDLTKPSCFFNRSSTKS